MEDVESTRLAGVEGSGLAAVEQCAEHVGLVNFVLVLMVNKVLSQTLFPRFASAAAALTIRWFSAVSRERIPEMVEPS